MKKHPVQIDSERWNLLWQEARKSKKPMTPSQVLFRIIDKHFKRNKKSRS